MDNQRKKQMSQQRKRLRCNRRLFFFVGLLLGGSGVFGFYYFYYTPQLTDTNTQELTKQTDQLKLLAEENKKLQNQLTTNLQQLKEQEEKNKARMTFGQLNNGQEFPELASEIEKKITDANFIGSLLVIKNNNIVLEKGYGYSDKTREQFNGPTTEFLIASVQKSFTAVLIMTLIEQGLLTIETPLSTYYPTIPNSEEITIKKLLNMTSGLQLTGKNPNSLSEEDTLSYTVANVTYSPLSKWRYSAVNYTLLAGIIRQLTGQSYQDYFTSQITTKLNLQHTGFYPSFYLSPNHAVSSDENSAPYAVPNKTSDATFAAETGTGNVYSSVGDLLTFIQALIDQKLISKESLAQLWSRPKLAFDYSYAGGFYHNDVAFNGHGIFAGFEPTLNFSSDGSTGVITLSNYIQTDSKNANLTKDIFTLIKK